MKGIKKAQIFGYRSDICSPISQVKYFKEESKGFDAKLLQENKRFAGRCELEKRWISIVTVKSYAL